MTLVKTDDELKQLFQRHLALSADGLRSVSSDHLPSLVIWPESPMNFTYASDSDFRAAVTSFVSANHTSLLFNSLEPAPNDGAYNSAVLINEEGRLIAQYDKIRLMPFGEYVPLPHWLPGASLISGLVGDFAPGKNYVLMPVAGREAGVFICIESAYPDVARKFAEEGADVLINISNDGYLGPSAVMRQHLANAVFRAVENARPLLSVTNTGVTAFIRPDGVVQDQTTGFQTAVRTWRVGKAGNEKTFYTRHGDLFVEVAVVAMALIVIITLLAGKRSSNRIGWKRI
jgi:apolipoprotein N-acyltransferase